MKKTILLIIIALTASMGCWAQETSSSNSTEQNSRREARRTMRGFKMMFEAGYLWNPSQDDVTGVIVTHDAYRPTKGELTASFGYQFNNFFFLGGGTGAMLYRSAGNTYLVVPAFAEFRVNCLNAKRFTPYIDGRFGAGFGSLGGFYIGCEAGVRYALPKKHAITLACQYDEMLSIGDSDRSDIDNCGLGFKVGFEF